MLEQNKKKRRERVLFFQAGCHRLGSEKWQFSGKRIGFLKSDKETL